MREQESSAPRRRDQTLRLALLGAALVLVLAVGGWLVLGRPLTGDGTAKDAAGAGADTVRPGDAATAQPLAAPYTLHYYELAWQNSETTQLTDEDFIQSTLLLQTHYRDGRACRLFSHFSIDRETGEMRYWLEVRDIADGAVLQSYGPECFYDCPHALFFDADGQLWVIYALYDEADTEGERATLYLAPCAPGGSLSQGDGLPQDAIQLGGLGELPPATAWQEYQALQCRDCLLLLLYDPETQQDKLHLYDLATHTDTVLTVSRSNSFCTDGGDRLFYVDHSGWPKQIVCYSVSQKAELWRHSCEGSTCEALYCTADGTLTAVLRTAPEGNTLLQTLDAADGSEREVAADLATDVELNGGSLPATFWDITIGAAADGRIYLSQLDYDLQEMDDRWLRLDTWCLQPKAVTVDPAKAVTLTITAPYPVESIQGALKRYQRLHPDVAIVWDTQYANREDFRPHSLQYKEQMALRVMTGDIGDLVMINGSGLSQDIITTTDALADLSGYLENCPFQDELQWSFLEALRDPDGAIRALPLAWQPTGYTYNETLLAQLKLRPETLTWSQLLAVAQGWQQNGTELGLTSTTAKSRDQMQENLLYNALLANLYLTPQPDGSVALDTPALRGLLTQFHDLWNTPYLVRTDGGPFAENGMQKALFCEIFHSNSIFYLIRNVVQFGQNTDADFSIRCQPQGENGIAQQGYAFCWGVSSFSQKQDAAWQLLAFLAADGGLPLNSYSQDTMPLNRAACQSYLDACLDNYQTGGAGQDADAFYKVLDEILAVNERPFGRLDEPYGWAQAVYTPVLDYMNGRLTLDEAMAAASENWEKFLKG